MNLEFAFKIAGILLMILGPAHLYFYKYFDWEEESRKMSPLNGQIFLVHSFFISLVVLMMGILLFFYTRTLLMPSALGRLVLLGLLIFWSSRLIIQLFFYDVKLWKGNPLYTFVHISFTFLWTYLVVILVYAYRQIYFK